MKGRKKELKNVKKTPKEIPIPPPVASADPSPSLDIINESPILHITNNPELPIAIINNDQEVSKPIPIITPFKEKNVYKKKPIRLNSAARQSSEKTKLLIPNDDLLPPPSNRKPIQKDAKEENLISSLLNQQDNNKAIPLWLKTNHSNINEIPSILDSVEYNYIYLIVLVKLKKLQ